MKKNRFLKLASGLVILCLITTCAISATFAKYTTGGSTQDQARVAKWGVSLSISGDQLFDNEYYYANEDGKVSVKSEDDQNVVAPGTSSANGASDDGYNGVIFAITGTPEVAVNIKIDLTITSEICLGAGEYGDETTTNPTDAFTIREGETYYPVVYTLYQIGDATTADYDSEDYVELAKGNLAAIQSYLNTYNTTANYAPNTNLASKFLLTWAWDFESGNDAADTYLGNRMAEEATEIPGKLVLTTAYEIVITVTQID